MPNFRRVHVNGGTYFFTVVTHNREPFFTSDNQINLLKDAFHTTKEEMPYSMNAIVILPDHLHCIWTLPATEDDFSARWQKIKAKYTKLLRENDLVSQYTKIWQPRFWEHLIRNESDLKNHIDYIHYNPVKHGLVNSPKEWKHSTFRKYVRHGWYEDNWGSSIPESIKGMDFE